MPTISQEVKYGQDTSLEHAPLLTEEEAGNLKKKMEALDTLLATQQLAKYKIEILFSHERGGHKPYPGGISLWESGNQLHGGGDTKVYECPSEHLGRGLCAGIIGGSSQGYGHLVCPICQHVWKDTEVSGERLARLTTQNWAILLYQYYVRVGHNADLYMKYMPRDLRKASDLEQVKQQMGEHLNKVRGSRRLAIYPLKNIVKDVSAGADIVRRFQAFLSV